MKIIRQIPNTITCLNLLCGVFGVLQALEGHLDIAFYLMLAGAACDFCDGLAARLLNAYSPMGKELDSLADLITFGLLPAVMLYKCMDWYNWGQWICYIPFIITVFSALRLAKFNVDDRQGENFIGLATPACAMICHSARLQKELHEVLRLGALHAQLAPAVLHFLVQRAVEAVALGSGQRVGHLARTITPPGDEPQELLLLPLVEFKSVACLLLWHLVRRAWPISSSHLPADSEHGAVNYIKSRAHGQAAL